MTAKMTIARKFFLMGAVASMIAACQAKPSVTTGLPHSSSMVASGSGNLAYRTTQTGQVYVLDITNNLLLFSGPVIPGQLVQLDPANQKLSIDRRLLAEPSIKATDHFEIYLDTQALPTPQ
jgi:hypothetical protein